jgi:hypothetical protein
MTQPIDNCGHGRRNVELPRTTIRAERNVAANPAVECLSSSIPDHRPASVLPEERPQLG